MFQKSPSYRAGRLAFRFRRSGCDGRSLREFRNLDHDTRAALMAVVDWGADEVPAFGYYLDDRSWLLVSSHRLVWSSTFEGRTSLDLREITDATISHDALVAAGGKDRVNELVVLATGNRSFTILVEEGGPLSGIWNALKTVASWNPKPGDL